MYDHGTVSMTYTRFGEDPENSINFDIPSCNYRAEQANLTHCLYLPAVIRQKYSLPQLLTWLTTAPTLT
jgi:hypothetical protein